MKLFAAASLAALAIAGSASAWNFVPIGHFNGSGVINFYLTPGKNTSCPITYNGLVDAKGVAKITRIGALCYDITPVGLPWFIRPTTPSRARFPAAAFNVPGEGPCLPTEMHLELSGSTITERVTDMPNGTGGNCKVWGWFTTNHTLRIVP